MVEKNEFEQEFNTNEVVSVPDIEESKDKVDKCLRVYKRKSTFKGAKDTDFWYTGNRSDGNSVTFDFKCPITTESKAFEIRNVVGTMKKKEVIKDGETYINFTYYVTSCDFSEIKGEELPL